MDPDTNVPPYAVIEPLTGGVFIVKVQSIAFAGLRGESSEIKRVRPKTLAILLDGFLKNTEGLIDPQFFKKHFRAVSGKWI